MLAALLALLVEKQSLLKRLEGFVAAVKAEIDTIENRITLLKSADVSAVIHDQKSATVSAQAEELLKVMGLVK